MTPDELREQCQGSEYVVLRLPAANSEGCTRGLCGRRGPRGAIICGRPGEYQLVQFLSKAVLRYLDKVEAEERERKKL